MKKICRQLRKFLLANFILFSATSFSQTTVIATQLPGDTSSGAYASLVPATVTFGIENNNNSPVVLKQVEMIFNYAFVFSGTIPRLWYSATSLAGTTSIAESGEWFVITTGTPVAISTYGFYPLFQDLAFTIPAHTQYRFAVESSRGLRYDVSGGPYIYDADGITLKIGLAPSTPGGSDTVGCGGNVSIITGSADCFAGRITLEPATSTPVTLLNLTTAYNNKNANLINWQTSQELNSSHFNVQRAYTLPNFTTIQTIPAAGNSSTVKSYSYTDDNIEYKPTFYRLQQVDKDGRYTYSKTVQVNPYKNNLTISHIYPNPAHGSITVEYNSNSVTSTNLLVTDMLGRQVKKMLLKPAIGFNKQQIDISALAKGRYTVTLIKENEKAKGEFVKY